jgi:hypothetical protein
VPVPGFDDPAVAAPNSDGNLYFEADAAVATKVHATPTVELGAPGQAFDTSVPNLMFGEGTATTGSGEPIVSAAKASRGHWSEIFNFHGSPAPWVLIGILLAAGLLHLSAQARLKGQL